MSKDTNIQDENEFLKIKNYSVSLVVNDKEVPIRYTHHSDYKGDVKAKDIFDAFNYSVSGRYNAINLIVDSEAFSTVVEFKKFALKLKSDFENAYLNEQELLFLANHLDKPELKYWVDVFIANIYKLRNMSEEAVKSGLIGDLFNYNRLKDAKAMEKQGSEEPVIKLRNLVKDLELDLKDEYGIDWKREPVRWGILIKSMNLSLFGESKIDRNTASVDVLMKIKKIYKSTLDEISDIKLLDDLDKVEPSVFEKVFKENIKLFA